MRGTKRLRPRSRASSSSIWVAMPTWQESSWQPRQMVQPMATIDAVPKPSRLAPMQISLMQSTALRRPPSAQISTRSRMPASVSAWCARTVPISQGSPARRRACWRAAPVPPS